MQEKIKVLYVDDEENNLISFKAVYRLKYKVFTAISPMMALEILDENPDIHIVITDQRMPDITGVEFLKIILIKHPFPIRIMLTGFSDMKDTVDAVNYGKIFNYLTKPWDEVTLTETIENAVIKYKEEDRLRQRAQQAELAERSANQMEFLLRQNLLS
ncbi:MAG: response regulator [Bacteroidia bacterium]|nr:response regulator [Bacteroidia bacterium]